MDWSDHPGSLPTPLHRTERPLEDLVLTMRQHLRDTRDLGAFGATAVHRERLARGIADPPALRTIGLILQRRGALDYRHRLRRPPPPPGWYLPDIADGRAALDSFAGVEGLFIQGGSAVAVLHGISRHGGLVVSWPHTVIPARGTVDDRIANGRAVGLPGDAPFDNDPLFEGAQVHPDPIGRVARACLSRGMARVFVPSRETGFLEGVNGPWQAKVWARFHPASLHGVQAPAARYVAAHRQHRAARIAAAPARRPFPRGWRLDLHVHAHRAKAAENGHTDQETQL